MFNWKIVTVIAVCAIATLLLDFLTRPPKF